MPLRIAAPASAQRSGPARFSAARRPLFAAAALATVAVAPAALAADLEPYLVANINAGAAGSNPEHAVQTSSKPGRGKRHTISIIGTDQAGNVGRAERVKFRVIRRR